MSDLAAWIWAEACALDPWPWGPFWVALACGVVGYLAMGFDGRQKPRK